MPSRKRKLTSPLIECKSSKAIKFTEEPNEDFIESTFESSIEENAKDEFNNCDKNIEVTINKEDQDIKQDDGQNHEKNEKLDVTPKRTRNAKINQRATNALTKFLKDTDKQMKNIKCDGNSLELEDKIGQNMHLQEKEDDICSECTDIQSTQSQVIERLEDTNSTTSKNKENDQFCDKSINSIISSSNIEDKNILDKSISNSDTEETDRNATNSVILKDDNDIKKGSKTLTPKQLQKRQEIAKKKEEREKLRMVTYIHVFM